MPAATSTTPVAVRLETANPALAELAEKTRLRLGQGYREDADWALLFDDEGVELLASTDTPGRGVRAGTRRPERVSSKQPFARALGRAPKSVVDATAGLGDDALLMFALGHQVMVIERSPVACALLEGAALMGRFPFPVVFGDARELLPDLKPEVIYLDPMFPPKRSSSALPPKAPRYLACVLGPDPDTEQLLATARRSARDRVVLKRPDHVASLGPAPRSRHKGKLVRYDVYGPVVPGRTTPRMSDAWFHAPELTGDSRTLKLSEQEARHAVRVRRLETGDRIVVFNGRGVWAQAELKNKNGDLEILGTHEASAQTPRIHLAAALPKGERFGVLLSMATQLGIATFTPLSCEHGVVQPGKRHAVRGQRILVEACKQSRNAWLPDWRDPATPAELKSVTLYAQPGGISLATLMDGHVAGRADDPAVELTVLVGPEGGFSVAETTELDAQGAAAVSLGANILRIETAAVALIAGLRLMSGSAVNSSAESLS